MARRTRKAPKRTGKGRKRATSKRSVKRPIRRVAKKARKAAPKPKRAPARPRPPAEEVVPTPPSSLNMNRRGSAARSGRAEMAVERERHRSFSPELAGGDADVDLESAYFSGEEAPGGDNPTPDQDVVDEIGRAVGVEYLSGERLYRAYFTEQRSIFERDSLVSLAESVGIDRRAAHDALEHDRFAEAVVADGREARGLGVSGVPFFVLGGRYGISGAQAASVFSEALDKAW